MTPREILSKYRTELLRVLSIADLDLLCEMAEKVEKIQASIDRDMNTPIMSYRMLAQRHLEIKRILDGEQ